MFGHIASLALFLLPLYVNGDFETSLLTGCNPNESLPCGGQGTCNVPDLTCNCNDLWSFKADFVMSESDCPTSFIGIYVLWALNLVEILYIIYSTAYVMFARAEAFWESRKKSRENTLWKNKGLLALVFYISICLPSHIVFAILHFVQPDTAIGFELFPSILFFTGKLGFYLASMCVQGPLVAAVLKNNADTKGLVKFNMMTNLGVSCVSIAIGGLPFVTLMHFPHNIPVQIQIYRAYFWTQSICLLINAVQAYMVKRWIFQALDRVEHLSSSNKTTHIKRKINDFQMSICKQGTLQAIVYFLMAAIPFFLNKHQYFLPISWLAMPILWKKLAFQFDLDKANVKTLAARLGLKKEQQPDSALSSNGNNSKKPSKKQVGNQSTLVLSQPQQIGSMSVFQPPPVPPSPSANKKEEEKERRAESSVSTRKTMVLSVVGDEMEEILEENGELRKAFEAFVEKRHATESLALYDACVAYEKLTSGWNKAGHRIILQHVLDSSPLCVDMEFSLRKTILDLDMKKAFKPNSMVEVKKMALGLLRTNFYFQFRNELESKN